MFLNQLTNGLNNILNVMIPPVCYTCNSRITIQKDCVCNNCFINIERNIDKLNGSSELGVRYFSKVESLYDYGQIVRELIHVYKYSSIKEIGRYLGRKAEEVLRREYPDFLNCDAIMSVPMHRSRYEERAFDHANYLLKIINKTLQITDYSKYIEKSVNTPKQAFLDIDKRLQNPKNSFRIKNSDVFKNKNILLIDDIFTSGATVNSVCKLLKENGANYINVFTIAAAGVK